MRHKYTLQLFAEGGASGTGGSEGVSGTPGAESTAITGMLQADNSQVATDTGMAAGEVTDPAEGTTAQKVDSEPETFESLIKGKYKDDYDKRVQQTVEKRLKNVKQSEENLSKLQPVIDILSEKYGIKADDLDALVQKVSDDNDYYSKEALERGIDVNELKHIKTIERENARYKAQQKKDEEDAANRRQFNAILQQVPDVQKLYPSFDIRSEMENGDFFRLVHNGVPVKTAFEVIHQSELQPVAMQVIAQKTQEQVVNAVKANQNRPNETGLNGGGATTKLDPSKFTLKDFKDLQARAQRGEKITFS